jgi:hypothetical protein
MVDLISFIGFFVRRNNRNFDACASLMQLGFTVDLRLNPNSETVKFSSGIGSHLIAI